MQKPQLTALTCAGWVQLVLAGREGSLRSFRFAGAGEGSFSHPFLFPLHLPARDPREPPTPRVPANTPYDPPQNLTRDPSPQNPAVTINNLHGGSVMSL